MEKRPQHRSRFAFLEDDFEDDIVDVPELKPKKVIPNGASTQNSKISNEQVDCKEKYGITQKKISNDITKVEEMNSNTPKLSETAKTITETNGEQSNNTDSDDKRSQKKVAAYPIPEELFDKNAVKVDKPTPKSSDKKSQKARKRLIAKKQNIDTYTDTHPVKTVEETKSNQIPSQNDILKSQKNSVPLETEMELPNENNQYNIKLLSIFALILAVYIFFTYMYFVNNY